MDLSMPSSDRSALIEGHLDAELRFAARHLAVLHDVPPHRWAAVASLRRAFEVAAVQRRTEELQGETDWSKERCFHEACHELRVPSETIRSRQYRAFCGAH